MKRLLLLLTFLLSACSTNPKPVTPPPTPPAEFCVAVNVHSLTTTGTPIAGANVWVNGATGKTNQDGYLYLYPLSAGPSTIRVTASGFDENDTPYTVSSLQCDVPIALTPAIPPVPTREQVLSSHMVFQGLTVHTSRGDLPWFDAALFSPELANDRPSILAQKKAAGDTAADVLFYGDNGLLYNEPGQPYATFHEVDYEHNPDQFVEAVVEVLRAGFTPWVYLQGDGPDNYPVAVRQFPIALNALKNSKYGDLSLYVLFKPGWDSVFYGWEPSHDKIPGFAALVRSLCPLCRLGIEFNTGHIPIGEGGSDYQAGGDMMGYDLLDVEFDDSNIHGDATWQILARLLGPAYVRPNDQPANDDPRAPYYLSTPTPRGPWAVDCFEFKEFEWVRSSVTAAQVQADRDYLLSLGCKIVG